MNTGRSVVLLGLLALWLSVSVAPRLEAQSQSIYASIVGSVIDTSGAAVPGATVTATNVGTNISTTATSDAQGFYRIEGLITGTYRVTVELSGFKTFVREGIAPSSAQTVRLDVELHVGEMAESVTVTRQTPLIETDSPQISSTMLWDTRKYLPTRTNNFYTTLALESGAVTSRPGFIVSFAGSGRAQYDYTIDGATFRSSRAGHNATLGDQIEWLQEQKVDYVNNSAEYATLAVVNATTKSGTNQLHGSAVEHYTSGGLQGRSPFTTQRPSGVLHRFAGSLGGPIVSNRTFFFGSYAGERNHSAALRTATVPTELMRQGNFSELSGSLVDPTTRQPFPNNTIPPDRMFSGSQAFLDRFYPLPNRGGAAFSPNNYEVSIPQAPAADDVFVRVDHRFSNRHAVLGHYAFDEGGRGGRFTGSLPTVGFRRGYRRGQHVVVSDRYTIAPTVFNELSASWTRDHNLITADTFGNEVIDMMGLEGVNPPTVAGIPAFNIQGFTTVSLQGFQNIQNDFYTVRDNISWVTGRHRMKAGILFARGSAGQIPFNTNNFFGNFRFNNAFGSGNALADFLLGLPATRFRLNADFFESVDWNRDTWQAFVQDDIQLTRNLTLNVGVRYEYFENFLDENGRQYAYDPATGTIVVPNEEALGLVAPSVRAAGFELVTAQQAGFPNRLVDFGNGDVSPRIGLAWRPFTQTVIRAGYGIFRDFLPPHQGNIAPFVPSESFPPNQITNGVPAFQFPAPFSDTPLPSGALTLSSAPPTLVVPYSQQWSLTIERELRSDTAVRVSYIGTRSVNQVWGQSINIPEPSTTPFSQSRRPDPQFGNILQWQNGSDHFYQALEVRVEHRGPGLYLRTGWTWAKDVGVNQGTGDIAVDSVLNPFDRDADKGNAFFTPRHRWVTVGTWEVPVGRGRRFGSGMSTGLNVLLGGWQLTGIATVASGHWLTPTVSGFDSAGIGVTSGRPDRWASGVLPADERSADLWFDPSAFSFPGGAPAPVGPPAPSDPIGRFGNSGVGIIEGPGMWQVDVGLVKSFQRIAGRTAVSFVALATNVFNHPNLGDPSMDVSNPETAGRIFSIRGDANASGVGMRNIQLGLRVEF